MTDNIENDVAVVGAGPAGVAVAVSLRDRGLRPLLIEKADHVAASWRGRYDKLRLHTGRRFSHPPNRPHTHRLNPARPLPHLPNRQYPKGTPTFPGRDEVVAHLDQHAHDPRIDLRLGTEVTRIDRVRAGWVMRTSTGDIRERQGVV